MVNPINLEIEITPSRDGFDVKAATESSGRAGPEPLDWAALQAPEFRALVLQIRDQPLAVSFETFRQVGETLFDAVFSGQVRRLFEGLYDQRVQPQRGASLRLRIDVTENAPLELTMLPWECMFWRGAPVATNVQTLLVRDLASIDFGGRGPLSIEEKPRVLLVIPRGSGLQTDRERDLIFDILKKAEIPCEILEGPVTLLRVDDFLAESEYHIVHFIGHGDADLGEDGRLQGRLRFNTAGATDEATDVEWVEEERIRSLFASHRSLRLVILNACEGASTDLSEQAGSGQGFIGMAPAILRAGIPAVIAMQYKLRDSTAIKFAETFYKRLTSERWAGEVDVAVTLARNACFLYSRDERGFATPVMFLHAPNGQLFHLPSSDPLIEPRDFPPSIDAFVGRERDLLNYRSILTAKHFVAITGMPGVGKSMLAAKLAQDTVTKDGKLFWHRFSKDERGDDVISELAKFLARNGQPDPWRLLNQQTGSVDQPRRPMSILVDLVRHIRKQGYVLCLDDIHHADADPLVGQLRDHLVRLAETDEADLIVTSRETVDVGATVDFVPLAGLSQDDAVALTSARGVELTQEQFGSVYEQTEGNAMLLTLTIAALQKSTYRDQLLTQLAGTGKVADYLLREVNAQLTDAERTVMNGVAVLREQPGTPAIIEALADGDSPFDSLRELCNRFLLNEVETAAGMVYSQHALVQNFYYRRLSQKRRQDMHARAAAYYQTEEQNLMRAAQHYQWANEHEQSAQLATADVNGAINRGQMGLLRHLLDQYRQAQIQPETWARVLLARGQVAFAYGEFEEARRSYQTADESLARLPQQAERKILRAAVCRQMAQVLMERSPNEALMWLRGGLDHLATLEVPAQAAGLHIAYGAALIHLGQFDVAEKEIDAGLGLLPADAIDSRIDAWLNLSVIHSSRGDLEKSIACTSEALSLAERQGDLFRLIKIHNSRAVDLIFSGKWQAGLDDLKEALHLGEQVGSKSDQVKVDLNLGSLYSKMGDEQAALSHWARSLELARKNDLNEMICAVQVSAAEVYLWQGESAQAEASLDEAQTLADRHGFQDLLPEIWRKRGQLRLLQGRAPEAEQDATRSVEMAERMSLDAEIGISLRVLAEIEMTQAPASNAAGDHLSRSLALLESIERHEAGRTRVAMGRLLLAQGDTEAARSQWAEARDAFRTLGAQRDLNEVTALLSSLSDSAPLERASGGGQ